MTEAEYINATNLAKIRIATEAIRDGLFTEGDEENLQKMILQNLIWLRTRCENKLAITTKPNATAA